MEDNLLKVENWYNETMERHLARFHELTYRSLQCGLMMKYIPIERALTTQLDREVERLGLHGAVPWKNERLPANYPAASKCLVAMTRTSDLNDIIIRSLAGYKESRLHTQATTNDFDSEDDVPITQLLYETEATSDLKNKKAEEDMPDLPPPNWDEGASDDDLHVASSSYAALPSHSSAIAQPSASSSSFTPLPTSHAELRQQQFLPNARPESGYGSDDGYSRGPTPFSEHDLAHLQTYPSSSMGNYNTASDRAAGRRRVSRQPSASSFSISPSVSDAAPSVYPSAASSYADPALMHTVARSNSRSKLMATPSVPSSTAAPAAAMMRSARQTPFGAPSPYPQQHPSVAPIAASPFMHAPSPFPHPPSGHLTHMDTFFEDMDDDREEDIVMPVRIDETTGYGYNAAAMPGTASPLSARGDHPPMSRSAFLRANSSPLISTPLNPSGSGLTTVFSGSNSPAIGLSNASIASVASPGLNTLGASITGSAAPDPAVDKGSMESLTSQLRREWSEFYRDLHLLKQFALLNVEGITKILNKHDKNISGGAKHRFLQLEGSKFAFLRREHLKLVIRETEHVFAQAFTGGHRTAAMSALRVSNEAPEVGMATFRFGFFLGVSIVMGFLVAFVSVITDSAYMIKLRPGLIVFRLLALITFLMWSWGLTMVVCTRYRINYTHIFEFTEKPLYQQVFEMAAFCTLVLTTAMLVFVAGGIQQFQKDFDIPLLSGLKYIPLAALPLVVFLFVFIALIFMQAKQGWWGVLSLGRVLAAPFFPVTFQDFYTAEILLSSCILLFDFQFSLCYFIFDSFRTSDSCQYSHKYVNALVALLPSAWRTMQCLRLWVDAQESIHLLNAGKYALGGVITLLAFLARVFSKLGNFWVALWLIGVVAITVISSYWDIIQDWMLGEQQVKYPGLRQTILLPARWYYAALAFTPLGRLLFALTISPDIVSNWLNADVFMLLIATVEIVRKTIWAILRLEKEQVQNADTLQPGFGAEPIYPDVWGEDILDAEFV